MSCGGPRLVFKSRGSKQSHCFNTTGRKKKKSKTGTKVNICSMEIALPVERFHVVKGSVAMLCCGLDLNKTKERNPSTL